MFDQYENISHMYIDIQMRWMYFIQYVLRFAVQWYNMAQLVDWKIRISIEYAEIKRAICWNVNYR